MSINNQIQREITPEGKRKQNFLLMPIA